MRIKITSIPVKEQQKALEFYTDILGFVKKQDIDMGNGYRWLTLVSAEDQDGVELLLEPSPVHFPPSDVFQKALFDAGIPYTQFYVEDLDAEYERLRKLNVQFLKAPIEMGTVKIAVFHDTCGNNIQLIEEL